MINEQETRLTPFPLLSFIFTTEEPFNEIVDAKPFFSFDSKKLQVENSFSIPQKMKFELLIFIFILVSPTIFFQKKCYDIYMFKTNSLNFIFHFHLQGQNVQLEVLQDPPVVLILRGTPYFLVSHVLHQLLLDRRSWRVTKFFFFGKKFFFLAKFFLLTLNSSPFAIFLRVPLNIFPLRVLGNLLVTHTC